MTTWLNKEQYDRLMESSKRIKLEMGGWKVGTVAEFLQLTPEEEAAVDRKLKEAKSESQIKKITAIKRRGR